jgi:hypothetical protein
MATLVNRSLDLTRNGATATRTLWMGFGAAFRHVAGMVTRQRRKVYASGLSDAWLRCNEIESAKHVGER